MAKPPSFWGKSDKELGVPKGVRVEDFSDSNLAAGLALQWSAKDGSFKGVGPEISYAGSKAFSYPGTLTLTPTLTLTLSLTRSLTLTLTFQVPAAATAHRYKVAVVRAAVSGGKSPLMATGSHTGV